MKKLTALTLVITLLFANTALAKFSDEYKAQYPKNVKVTTKQNSAGKTETTTWYKLFSPKSPQGLNLTLIDNGGTKMCVIYYTYTGNKWKFYDKLTWGDGETVHDLLPAIKPTREVHRGYVLESIATAINPTELKNAIILNAHTQNLLSDILLNESHKEWSNWKKALEDAEKIMAE